jgi:hypothetical protein
MNLNPKTTEDSELRETDHFSHWEVRVQGAHDSGPRDYQLDHKSELSGKYAVVALLFDFEPSGS